MSYPHPTPHPACACVSNLVHQACWLVILSKATHFTYNLFTRFSCYDFKHLYSAEILPFHRKLRHWCTYFNSCKWLVHNFQVMKKLLLKKTSLLLWKFLYLCSFNRRNSLCFEKLPFFCPIQSTYFLFPLVEIVF